MSEIIIAVCSYLLVGALIIGTVDALEGGLTNPDAGRVILVIALWPFLIIAGLTSFIVREIKERVSK